MKRRIATSMAVILASSFCVAMINAQEAPGTSEDAPGPGVIKGVPLGLPGPPHLPAGGPASVKSETGDEPSADKTAADKRAGHELRKLMEQREEAIKQSDELAAKYREFAKKYKPDAALLGQLKDSIRELLQRAYEAEHKIRTLRIKAARERLDAVEKQLALRHQDAATHIDQQLSQKLKTPAATVGSKLNKTSNAFSSSGPVASRLLVILDAPEGTKEILGRNRLHFVPRQLIEFGKTQPIILTGFSSHPQLVINATIIVPNKEDLPSFATRRQASASFNLTDEDLQHLQANHTLTKAVYFDRYGRLVTITSSKLDPGIDSVQTARDRGTLLATLRLSRLEKKLVGWPIPQEVYLPGGVPYAPSPRPAQSAATGRIPTGAPVARPLRNHGYVEELIGRWELIEYHDEREAASEEFLKDAYVDIAGGIMVFHVPSKPDYPDYQYLYVVERFEIDLWSVDSTDPTQSSQAPHLGRFGLKDDVLTIAFNNDEYDESVMQGRPPLAPSTGVIVWKLRRDQQHQPASGFDFDASGSTYGGGKPYGGGNTHGTGR